MALLKHVGDNWYCRFQFRGKAYLRSTGTPVKEVAEKWEKNFRRQLTEGRIEGLKKLGEIEVPKVLTIGQVIELYSAEGNEVLIKIKRRTMNRNVEALRRFVAISKGFPLPDLKAIGEIQHKNRRVRWAAKREAIQTNEKKVDAVSLDALTLQSVFDFQKNSLKLKFTEVGINSTLAQARSVFGENTKRFYVGVSLPNLKDFMKAQAIPQDHGESAFVEIPAETLQAMEEDFKKERDAGNVDLWRTYLLFRRLGMRNSEIRAAKGNWISMHNGKLKMCITNREDFRTKAGIERRITLSKELLAEFSNILPAEYLILPKGTKTGRADIVDRDCNVVVRKHLKRQKGCYELRKQAGAEVCSRPELGIYVAHKFLGHSNISTTEKHYAAYTKELNALEP